MQFNQTLLQFEQHKDKTSFDSNKQNTLESENQDLVRNLFYKKKFYIEG